MTYAIKNVPFMGAGAQIIIATDDAGNTTEIQMDMRDPNYVAYLEWVSWGNTPEVAD